MVVGASSLMVRWSWVLVDSGCVLSFTVVVEVRAILFSLGVNVGTPVLFMSAKPPSTAIYSQ